MCQPGKGQIHCHSLTCVVHIFILILCKYMQVVKYLISDIINVIRMPQTTLQCVYLAMTTQAYRLKNTISVVLFGHDRGSRQICGKPPENYQIKERTTRIKLARKLYVQAAARPTPTRTSRLGVAYPIHEIGLLVICQASEQQYCNTLVLPVISCWLLRFQLYHLPTAKSSSIGLEFCL